MSSPENSSDFPFDETIFPDLSVDPATGNFMLGDEILAPDERMAFSLTPGLTNLLNDNMKNYGESLAQTVSTLIGYAAQMYDIEQRSNYIVELDGHGNKSSYLPDATLDETKPVPEHLRSKKAASVAVTPSTLAAIDLYSSLADCDPDEAVKDLLAKGNWVRSRLEGESLEDGQVEGERHSFVAYLKSGQPLELAIPRN